MRLHNRHPASLPHDVLHTPLADCAGVVGDSAIADVVRKGAAPGGSVTLQQLHDMELLFAAVLERAQASDAASEALRGRVSSWSQRCDSLSRSVQHLKMMLKLRASSIAALSAKLQKRDGGDVASSMPAGSTRALLQENKELKQMVSTRPSSSIACIPHLAMLYCFVLPHSLITTPRSCAGPCASRSWRTHPRRPQRRPPR